MSINAIVINRGDTYKFDLIIPDEETGEKYILKDDDAVYMGIMDPRQMFEDALVKKVYNKDDQSEQGILPIVIKPEDTVNLMPGKYYYAIKLRKRTNNEEEIIDEVITVINKTKFVICD